MNRRSIGWVTAGALVAGMAVAGTRSIPADVRFSTFTGTNMTLPTGASASASLTLVESRDPSGALPALGNPVWHREPWIDGLQEDLAHFDLERWASTDSAREGADCWLDENFDGATLDLSNALIEDFAGHSFWVPQDPDDWDRNLGGGKTGQGTIKPGAVVIDVGTNAVPGTQLMNPFRGGRMKAGFCASARPFFFQGHPISRSPAIPPNNRLHQENRCALGR